MRAAYADFVARFGDDMTAVLVQRMVPKGVEMIVGAVQDPLFGPLIACGTGGVLVDVLADTAFRLHPLTASDTRDMLGELRGSRLLRGYRGAPPADEAALRDVLLRISELVTAASEIQELESESGGGPLVRCLCRGCSRACGSLESPGARPARRVPDASPSPHVSTALRGSIRLFACFAGADGQHGARRGPYDLVGHTPHHQPRRATASVRGHDHEVDVSLLA